MRLSVYMCVLKVCKYCRQHFVHWASVAV